MTCCFSGPQPRSQLRLLLTVGGCFQTSRGQNADIRHPAGRSLDPMDAVGRHGKVGSRAAGGRRSGPLRPPLGTTAAIRTMATAPGSIGGLPGGFEAATAVRCCGPCCEDTRSYIRQRTGSCRTPTSSDLPTKVVGNPLGVRLSALLGCPRTPRPDSVVVLGSPLRAGGAALSRCDRHPRWRG